MPLPAGTGLSRRRFVVGGLGAALAVYGGSQLGLRRVRGGNRRRPRPAPAQPVFVSVFLEGGADGALRPLAAGRPALPQAAPEARARPAAPPFAEDNRLYWHPALGGLAAALRARRRSPSCRPSATRIADQSPLHVAPLLGGRRDDANLRTGWLGRYLDRDRHDEQPAAGPLARRLARARARHGEGAGRVDLDARRLRASRATASGARSSSGCSRRSGCSARQHERPGARAPPARVTQQVDRLRRQLLPFQGDNGITSPVAYPTSSDAVPEAARRARRDARRRPAAPLRRR